MNDASDYKKYLIKKYNNWDVFLNLNQEYLGRIYFWNKSEKEYDFLDMSKDEINELLKIGKELKMVLNQLFNPDKYDYSFKGNETNHLHMHMVPRYKSDREFEGMRFVDSNWGESYRTNKKFKLPEEVLFTIRDTIKNKLIKL